MRKLLGIAIVACLYAAPTALSQTVQVSRQNKTIEVTVTQRISVDAEVADVTIGCLEYGPTHDSAFQENLRVADQVVKALLAAGVPKENITSSRIDLRENSSFDPESKAKAQADRRFIAHQSWVVRVSAADAQKIIDLAVRAGANGVESVSWDVKDPGVLELKARTAALEKARVTASEIALGLGAKLGEAVYASNSVEGVTYSPFSAGSAPKFDIISRRDTNSQFTFSLQLFSEKVEKEASVTVVFALE
jgi:uncharacterized protein